MWHKMDFFTDNMDVGGMLKGNEIKYRYMCE